jgi:hypothetical protein
MSGQLDCQFSAFSGFELTPSQPNSLVAMQVYVVSIFIAIPICFRYFFILVQTSLCTPFMNYFWRDTTVGTKAGLNFGIKSECMYSIRVCELRGRVMKKSLGYMKQSISLLIQLFHELFIWA